MLVLRLLFTILCLGIFTFLGTTPWIASPLAPINIAIDALLVVLALIFCIFFNLLLGK